MIQNFVRVCVYLSLSNSAFGAVTHDSAFVEIPVYRVARMIPVCISSSTSMSLYHAFVMNTKYSHEYFLNLIRDGQCTVRKVPIDIRLLVTCKKVMHECGRVELRLDNSVVYGVAIFE